LLLTVTANARILVVEDDSAIRQSLAELLEDEGFEVTCAANGAEALTTLAGGDAPSLILLDLTMPVMDGWTFRTAQRSDPSLARIPTVVLSASYGVDGAAIEGLEPAAFFAKPFDLERLIETVHKLC
jgi:CheY-like chemotaxis protein